MSDCVILELRKLLELALANRAAKGSMIRMGQLEKSRSSLRAKGLGGANSSQP